MDECMSAFLPITTPTKRTFLYLICLFLMTVFGLSGCGGGSSSSSKPLLSINNPSVLEGDSGDLNQLVFTLSLNKAADTDLIVDYETTGGTATATGGATDDYTYRIGSLTIQAGDTSVDLIIDVTGDDEVESHETLTLEITNIRGPGLENSATSLTGTGTITNDETVDPKGYYAGTATLDSTEYLDMTALVYNNRVLMFSPTANVLYDITLNNPDSIDYEGTVELYVDGQITQVDSITVIGQTDNESISGTFSNGNGFGVGSFEVTYDTNNNVGATLARIEATGFDQWIGNLYGIDVDTGRFTSYSDGHYGGNDDTTNFCAFPNGTTSSFVIPDADRNIYQMANPVEVQGFGTCETTYASTGHTGFAAVIDDGDGGNTRDDDKLLFAFDNGNIALFGIMYRP
jgi:hypothetical protein